MSNEVKVGIFVLAGLITLMAGVFFLGDIRLESHYRIHVLLKTAQGLQEKASVKVSGVKVGRIGAIQLHDDHVRVTVVVAKRVKLYKNATAKILSTSLIGTKFLTLFPGSPVPSTPEEAQVLKDGDTISSVSTPTFDEMMERLAKTIDDITSDGQFGKNINKTVQNLREITDALNAALGKQEKSLVNVIQNFEGLSRHAQSIAANLDEIIATTKKDLVDAIVTLKSTLVRLDDVMAKIQRGEGTVGALVSDQQVEKEVKDTIANLKQTTESAKEVLARFTKVRAFWEVGGRYDFKGDVAKADLGVSFRPRPNKFYRIVGQNLGRDTDERNQFDFERRNTITGVLGYDLGPWTLEAGFIRSRGGIGVALRPFQGTPVPVFNRLELHAEAFDFGRREVIRGRNFDKPNYIAGLRWKPYELWDVGVQAEDITELTSLHGALNVHFEDKDLAYLLGFISFAR